MKLIPVHLPKQNSWRNSIISTATLDSSSTKRLYRELLWEQVVQVHLDIKEVIMLEVAESIEMKADEYCHDFRPAHSTFPIAVLTPVRLTNGHAGNLLSYSWQKSSIIQKIFSNFVLGNLHNYSILLLYN